MKIHSLKVQKFGNYRVIVIPQTLLKKVENKKEEVIVEITKKGILLKNKSYLPRQGWSNDFRVMAKNNHHEL
jgi:antitoxin component of MazEF toxin-antitoxin module